MEDEMSDTGELFTEEEVQELIDWIESLTISELSDLHKLWQKSNGHVRQIQ